MAQGTSPTLFAKLHDTRVLMRWHIRSGYILRTWLRDGIPAENAGILNPFKPEFTIVIFIHFSQFSTCIVDEDDLMWFKN